MLFVKTQRPISFFFHLFLSFFISSFLFAQPNNIDSLVAKLLTEKSDENKIRLAGDICWEYLLIGNFEKALGYGNRELALAQKLEDDKSMAQAYSDLGSVYYSQGDYQNAITSYINSLQIGQKIKDFLMIGKNYNNLGAVHQRRGDNAKALDYWLKAMAVFEETNNKKAIHAILNNIAEIYRFNKDFEKALEYFQKSLKIKEELGDKLQIAATQSNIGMVYGDMGKIQESLAIFNKSLSIQKEIDDKVGIASSLLNIGILYRESEDYKKSLEFYNSSLEISTSIGDKHTVGLTFIGIGVVHLKLKNYNLAIKNFMEGLTIGKENGTKETIMKSYQGLAETNYGFKNFQKAYEYFELYAITKDSLFNEESNKSMAEMQTKYETEKKEKEIALQKTELEKKDAESKKQKIIIISVAGGLFLVILFAGFIFRSLRITKKQKHIIEIQKDEVTRQKHAVEQQKEIVEKQKEDIAHKNKDLTDSINYAQRIQSAILTSEQYLSEMFLPEEQTASHFILYKPKDIVAGDFYWAYKTQSGKAIWVAADCTGHGVPGAFMSMIGNSLLNEIVVEKKIEEPDEILNQLRAGVIKSLGQGTGADDKRKDGMDAAICIWDKQSNQLSFAGANNSLWLIRKGEFSEINPDIQPVGFYGEYAKPFTQKEIQLEKGDTLYTFTDGFCDQFGGPKGKKFKYKPFRELLLNIQEKSMPEQREILNQTIEQWQGELEQIDDICVFGVRV